MTEYTQHTRKFIFILKETTTVELSLIESQTTDFEMKLKKLSCHVKLNLTICITVLTKIMYSTILLKQKSKY